jgi:heat shock protein HslJ
MSMKWRRGAAATLLGAMGAWSCGPGLVRPSDLQGEWLLVSLGRPDSSTVPIADPTRFTLRFDEDGRLSLRADCNLCGGPYRLDGESLSSGPLACTKVFCATAPLDSQFVTILEGRSSIERKGSRLMLSSPRGSLAFAR